MNKNYEGIVIDEDYPDILNYVIFVECDYDVYSKVLHRIDGPAKIGLNTNYMGWYIFGGEVKSTREYCKFSNMDEETTMFWLLKYGEFLPSNGVHND